MTSAEPKQKNQKPILIVVSLCIVFKKTRTNTELHGTQFDIPLRNHTWCTPGGRDKVRLMAYDPCKNSWFQF